MRRKRQCFPAAVSFPETTDTTGSASFSEIATLAPSGANQRHRDGDDLGRRKAQPLPGASGSEEAGAMEKSGLGIKEVSSRSGRMLATPFSSFMRAALLAHLKRTFR